MNRTLVIEGLGLLGGSIAAGMRGRPGWKVVGVSSERSLAAARERNLCDEYRTRRQPGWLDDADVLLLCTTISGILSSLKAVAEDLPEGRRVLVSDIGSTKRAICDAGRQLPTPALFVGAHPMAGSEKRGAEHADAGIFENAYWIFCPPAGLNKAEWTSLEEIAQALGAVTVTLDAALHDRVLARLSHVPQLVATTLAGNLPKSILEQGLQHLAGRGFRDMTRIAASAYPMWRDILLSNGDEVEAGLAEFCHAAAEMHTLVSDLPDAADRVGERFRAGQEMRATLSNPGKGYNHGLCDVLVRIPDRDGALVDLLKPLAEAGIGIRDIEMQKVREGISGTVLVSFSDVLRADEAVRILSAQGMEAHRR